MEKKRKTDAEKRYFAYGIRKQNVFLWAAALFVAAAVAARIVYYSSPAGKPENISSFLMTVIFLILPCVCSLAFAVKLIVFGEKRLYKTAKPVAFYAVYLSARAVALYVSGDKRVGSGLLATALIIAYFALAVIYRLTVSTGGRKRSGISARRIVCACCFLLALAGQTVFELLPLLREDTGTAPFHSDAAIALDILAVLAVLAGLKLRKSERPLPQCGDRNNGRRVRSLDPLNGVAVYIMPDRCAANNLFKDSFDCAAADAYIREKREEGLLHFGYTHLLLAAYARTVAKLPSVNRFISGQRIYSRDDELEISMVIKKDMTLEGSETIITIYLDPHDTAYTVYEKFNREVEKAKATEELDSGFDKLAGALNIIPGVFMKFTVWVLKTLDYFGHLPRWLTELSPFHGSMFVTSMGSLGIPPVYHHLYNFGNIPVFLAFGMKRRENELSADGAVVQKRCIDFTVNIDERICDGFYFASAFKYFQLRMTGPKRLDTPPEEVNCDAE